MKLALTLMVAICQLATVRSAYAQDTAADAEPVPAAAHHRFGVGATLGTYSTFGYGDGLAALASLNGGDLRFDRIYTRRSALRLSAGFGTSRSSTERISHPEEGTGSIRQADVRAHSFNLGAGWRMFEPLGDRARIGFVLAMHGGLSHNATTVRVWPALDGEATGPVDEDEETRRGWNMTQSATLVAGVRVHQHLWLALESQLLAVRTEWSNDNDNTYGSFSSDGTVYTEPSVDYESRGTSVLGFGNVQLSLTFEWGAS